MSKICFNFWFNIKMSYIFQLDIFVKGLLQCIQFIFVQASKQNNPKLSSQRKEPLKFDCPPKK